MRAAIYARYSSENQRETSIEDQARLCRERATREGWEIVETYGDREVSASIPMGNRPGGRAMLAAAGHAWDLLVIESLDRCWRDIVDQERTLRRLEFAGVRIVGVSDAYDTRHEDRELQRGVRGLLNQQYLRDLAKKTHRGQDGAFARGFHAGGLAYGYRSEQSEQGSRLAIDEEQARWVRWIFERFADGWSPRRIAYSLNEQRAPSPRGGSWATSAIYGSPAKGTGILNNEAYAGRIVWNRSAWTKDPDTGKRRRIERPASEWRTSHRPELAIVSAELWQAARDRMDRPRLAGGRGKGAQPSTLFGGLMRCGICGGALIAINALRYGCAARKDRGATVCTGVSVRRDHADARLLAYLREQLLSDEAIAALQADVREIVAARQRDAAAGHADARRRLVELDAEIGRLVEAVAVVGVSPALAQRIRDAEAERARLQASMAPVRDVAVIEVREAAAAYRRLLLRLGDALARDIAAARDAVRELLGDVVVRIEGGEIIAECEEPAARLVVAAAGQSLNRVAGGCFRSRILLSPPLSNLRGANNTQAGSAAQAPIPRKIP